MGIVTRFAPSPTGYLHIGGARTALFNWLYARANGGKFLLRIEDTDRARSTDDATQAIYDGLKWLGLEWDGEAYSQFARKERHAEVAQAMLDKGHAYKCYATKAQIEAFRASPEGKYGSFQSPWRDADPATAPDAPYVIRLKAPRDGVMEITDEVQGRVSWKNAEFDDMILLRSDRTPTYMLAVVVDDHDMGVTHIIRGDDHLINAGRQSLIYNAMGWDIPVFAHIPLIFGDDGKKLSKRHGATGAEEYRAMGYLAEAMRNYLARLGWSHGDDELFTTKQAIEWFNLKAINKAPSRFDFKKLDNVNKFHIENVPDDVLITGLQDYIASQGRAPLTEAVLTKLKPVLPILRERTKKLPDLLDKARFILGPRPFAPDENDAKHLNSVFNGILKRLTPQLAGVTTWTKEELETLFRDFAETEGVGLGKVAQPMKVVLSGTTKSPSTFDMMAALGKDETLARINDATARM
ncbi:MAG: glutamate--tRNA ligase [Proteobacteria bacterium]|nr:glutamate--tRNA ligase [Pseudomonadota bacterium]